MPYVGRHRTLTQKALYMREYRARGAQRVMPSTMHRLLREVGSITPTNARVYLRSPVVIPPPPVRQRHMRVSWEPNLQLFAKRRSRVPPK